MHEVFYPTGLKTFPFISFRNGRRRQTISDANKYSVVISVKSLIFPFIGKRKCMDTKKLITIEISDL